MNHTRSPERRWSDGSGPEPSFLCACHMQGSCLGLVLGFVFAADL